MIGWLNLTSFCSRGGEDMEQVNVSPSVSPTLNPFVSVLVFLCVSISMFGEHDCA